MSFKWHLRLIIIINTTTVKALSYIHTSKFSQLPLTPPTGNPSTHTVPTAKKKKQGSSYFRQMGIWPREVGAEEILGRAVGPGFRLRLPNESQTPQAASARFPCGSRFAPRNQQLPQQVWLSTAPCLLGPGRGNGALPLHALEASDSAAEAARLWPLLCLLPLPYLTQECLFACRDGHVVVSVPSFERVERSSNRKGECTLSPNPP